MGLLIIGQAFLIATVVDAVAFHHATLADEIPWLGGLLGVFACRAVLTWVGERVAFEAGARVKSEVRTRLIRHVRDIGPVRLQELQSGEIATTIADGVEALQAYYSRYLPQTAIATLIPLAILVVVFPFDWVSGLILLITAPLIPVFMILIGKGAERLNQRQWRRLTRLGGHFLDVLQGLTTLKMFGASRREAALVSRLSEDYRRRTMAVFRVAFLSALVLEFLATVAIAMVAVLVGFRLLWGELDFRVGFFVLLLAPEFYVPLRALGTHYHARMEGIGAAESMVALLDIKAPSRLQGRSGLRDTTPVKLRFENVSFAYEPGRTALDDISFEIPQQQRVALVGPTGAGKSTVVHLLLGFVQPNQGRVQVNDQVLGELDPDEWLRHVAWVPQSPRIFHGTVRDNIALGLRGAAQRDIERAARNAQAAGFIDALPDGYETVLGERGAGLSGGQARRIAIARAFLKNAPLILLDEPTASLDAENEQLLTRGLADLAVGRTVVTIAHRLATVQDADRILVLERGRLVESGTYQELVARGGLFAQLASRT